MFIFTDKGTAIPITNVKAILPTDSGSRIEMLNGPIIPSMRTVSEILAQSVVAPSADFTKDAFALLEGRFQELDIPSFKDKVAVLEDTIEEVSQRFKDTREHYQSTMDTAKDSASALLRRLNAQTKDTSNTTTRIQETFTKLEEVVNGLVKEMEAD